MNEKRKPTYQEIIKLCNKKDKEIERLNNIINDLLSRIAVLEREVEKYERY